MVAELFLAACLLSASDSGSGTIVGVVVNASRNDEPVGGSEVVLRARGDGGQFVPVEQTTADAKGHFAFSRLPTGPGCFYLPGANRDGIHYPGARTELTDARPNATLRISVCDALAAPSPLVIRQHEVTIRPEPGALHVTESLRIENPTKTCFVGQAQDGGEPVTLELAIPPTFERTTFAQEFFGRRFWLFGGKLVTNVPWQPGQRELKFTYVLPNSERHRVWDRPLDLPCESLRVRIQTDAPDEVICNLVPAADAAVGEVLFETSGESLPAGHMIRVELGRLPLSWMARGRWTALVVLIVCVAGGSLTAFRRHKKSPPERPPEPPRPNSRRGRRGRRVGRIA